MKDMLIRPERPEERRAVESLVREAFWNLHVPGCDEHLCLHHLRSSPDFIPELNLVAELRGQLVGQVAYTRARIERPDGGALTAVCFGPVAVLPGHQRRGIGSALIRHSLDEAARMGHERVLIYGDPRYYARFGFRSGEVYGISAADGVYAVALMALSLKPGALAHAAGRFVESPDYETDPEELEAFDAGFPPKQKAQTESQRVFEVLRSLRY